MHASTQAGLPWHKSHLNAFFRLLSNTITSNGQTFTHLPQPVHLLSLITGRFNLLEERIALKVQLHRHGRSTHPTHRMGLKLPSASSDLILILEGVPPLTSEQV